MELEGTGVARGVTFRVKDVPVLYVPYFVFPANTQRQSGFLLPRVGYSNRRVAGFESEYQSPYLMGLSFGAAPWEGRLVYPPAFAALSEDAPLRAHD